MLNKLQKNLKNIELLAFLATIYLISVIPPRGITRMFTESVIIYFLMTV